MPVYEENRASPLCLTRVPHNHNVSDELIDIFDQVLACLCELQRPCSYGANHAGIGQGLTGESCRMAAPSPSWSFSPTLEVNSALALLHFDAIDRPFNSRQMLIQEVQAL